MAIAVSAISSLLAFIISLSNTPYTSIKYHVYSTDITDRLEIPIPCSNSSAVQYFDYETKYGKTAHITLCFVSVNSKFENGTEFMGVPYKTDSKGTWTLPANDNRVLQYTQVMKSKFKMTDKEEASFFDQHQAQFWKSVGDSVLYIALSNLAFWGLFYILTWVFAGFKKTNN